MVWVWCGYRGVKDDGVVKSPIYYAFLSRRGLAGVYEPFYLAIYS